MKFLGTPPLSSLCRSNSRWDCDTRRGQGAQRDGRNRGTTRQETSGYDVRRTGLRVVRARDAICEYFALSSMFRARFRANAGETAANTSHVLTNGANGAANQIRNWMCWRSRAWL